MSSKGSDSKSSRHPGINPVLLASLAAAGFIALLIIIIYLTQRLESVEDTLSYTFPASQAQTTIAIDITDSQTVYVPIYSHIYSKGGEPYLLEATLSIRNSDPERSIDITSVNYYDTKGKSIQEYLEGKLTLGPLETTAFLVENADTRGGSGANFIVAWKSDEPVYEPIIEAVMIGLDEGHSISFKSIGRPLAKRAKRAQHTK